MDEAVDERRLAATEAASNAQDGFAGNAREVVQHLHLGENRLHIEHCLGFAGQRRFATGELHVVVVDQVGESIQLFIGGWLLGQDFAHQGKFFSERQVLLVDVCVIVLQVLLRGLELLGQAFQQVDVLLRGQ
ncbi:hypothetical protein D3C71_1889450 [compost metagenome]